MGQPPDRSNPFDPFGLWRNAQDTSLESWSKTMIELVNSQPYAEATARMLDTYLTMSIPMRKLLAQTMEQTLGQLNMPTRADVISVAERMTNIEMRLDDLDARLDDFASQLAAIASAVAASASTASRSTAEAAASAARSVTKPATPAKPTPKAPASGKAPPVRKPATASAKPRKAQ